MTKSEDRLSRHAERITAVETLQGEMNTQVKGIGERLEDVQKALSWQTKALIAIGTIGTIILGWVGSLLGKFIEIYLKS